MLAYLSDYGQHVRVALRERSGYGTEREGKHGSGADEGPFMFFSSFVCGALRGAIKREHRSACTSCTRVVDAVWDLRGAAYPG
jgi:hypothetical protein